MDTIQLERERDTNPHLELQRQLIAEGLLDDIRLEQRFEPFERIPVKGRFGCRLCRAVAVI
jgi:hypothetical protein